MEIERKFIVTEPPHALQAATSARLRQGYLAIGAQAEVRLRDAGGEFTLSVKSGSGLVRQEHEIGLTPDQFEALWPATAGRRLEKTRYTVPVGELRYEIDEYEGSLTGLMIVEVEFRTTEAALFFTPSDWFGREVTGDAAYTNASLALHGVPEDLVDAR